MSEIKVNKLSPRTNCGTVQLGDSGDTITIPAGATITNNGTAAGFGATGAASWDTTVKTSGFTAVSGVGYFVDTTSGAISVNLPAGVAGDVVAIKDYANTFDTNNVTLVVNGSDKIGGLNINGTLSTEGLAVTLVFVDSTQGWLVTDNGTQDTAPTSLYVTATGGTITCSGDYRIHTFTGPGTFTVSCSGNAAGSNTVDYLVVAGGGGGGVGNGGGGGGGAGGYRESSGAASGCYSASPLGSGVSALPVSVQGYPIAVGGGGAGIPASSTSNGNAGINSTFSTIVSAGGGYGAGCIQNGGNGGSGGGAGKYNATGGTGNTPPVSPPQGNPGGSLLATPGGNDGGGGGGAGCQGETIPTGNTRGGSGGVGVTSSISGTPTGYAGGGGGNSETGLENGGTGGFHSGGSTPSPLGSPSPQTPGFGGGNGSSGGGACQTAGSGSVNTGGGAGGVDAPVPSVTSGTGGSGIVIIRYKFQN